MNDGGSLEQLAPDSVAQVSVEVRKLQFGGKDAVLRAAHAQHPDISRKLGRLEWAPPKSPALSKPPRIIGVEILMRHADPGRQQIAVELVAAGSWGRADDQRLPRRIRRWPVIIGADEVHRVGSLRYGSHCQALLTISIQLSRNRYPDLNFGAMRYTLRHASAPEVKRGA